MTRPISLLIAALLLLASLAIRADDLPQLDAKDTAQFSALMQISTQKELTSEQIRSVDRALSESNQAVKALALALAYKHEIGDREALFPSMREVFHYRLPPGTKSVSVTEFTATLGQIENANPNLSGQGHVLLGYLYFKEHHLLFGSPERGQEPVAAASMLRTLFLSTLFQDSDVDTKALIRRFYEPTNPQ